MSINKPLFAIVISEEALEKKVKENGSSVIEKENVKELKLFKELVLKNLVRFYDDKKDIKISIHETLSDFAYRKELKGWIRGDNNINTAVLAEEIARLTKENSELRNSITENSNVLYSNLTYRELKELLEKSKYRGLDSNIFKNLFEYIVEYGHFYVETTYMGKDELISLNELFVYKILEKSPDILGLSQPVKFSGDGHNFYLKALSEKKQKVDCC